MTTFAPESGQKTQHLYFRPTHGRSNVTPAITEGTDLLETLAFQHISEIDQPNGSSGNVAGCGKEVLEILSSLFSLHWELLDIERVPLPKEIGHEDLGVGGLGQDIGSLQSLREVAALVSWYPIET